MGIPTLEELMQAEVSASGFEPLAIGWYNGVITKTEVKDGQKAAYISVEVTVHDEDSEYHKRLVWGITSFSDKAVTMPGGVANLLQTTEPDIPLDTPVEELPAVMAVAIVSSPVSFEVRNEQVKRGGKLQFLDAPADTIPEMRSKVANYRKPEQEFIDSIDASAVGLDSDLPFPF